LANKILGFSSRVWILINFGSLICEGAKNGNYAMSEKNFRFRSSTGTIFSNNPKAFAPKVTTTRARQMLNEFYEKLCEYDKAAAEEICKKHNA